MAICPKPPKDTPPSTSPRCFQGINGAVGPTGQLRALPDTVGFKYSEIVAEFYQFFPRGTAVGMDRISAVSPRRDPNTGKETPKVGKVTTHTDRQTDGQTDRQRDTHACTHACARAHTHSCTQTHTHTHTHTQTHARIHTQARTHARTHARTQTG